MRLEDTESLGSKDCLVKAISPIETDKSESCGGDSFAFTRTRSR